jgi:hypothetical protein
MADLEAGADRSRTSQIKRFPLAALHDGLSSPNPSGALQKIDRKRFVKAVSLT